MLVSYYRTYTHFFQRNLLHLAQISPYLDDKLRIYSTHNYLQSNKEEFAGSIRFALVRDPIECITSSITLDATAGKLTPKRVAYVIDEWVDFHTKLLKEDNLNQVGGINKNHIKKKIHIGYFSADFHNHATMHLIAELFELHNKDEFNLMLKILLYAVTSVSNIASSLRNFNFMR